ncbi:MAG: TonB family protein [Candidatus Sulfotelmatobacter sp.]
MGYQALLFCPDEKTARVVTQVLSELDFEITTCAEPFSAVKKMMGGRFDAIVVDCDNEQNATLLFKSARNAPNNQSALAVAVVEGQAGVAKAFRIGANLVLTKPINVEQSKGTLRVARGLLRKSESAKAAAAATAKSVTSAPEKLVQAGQSAEPSLTAVTSVAIQSPSILPSIPVPTVSEQTPQTSFAASASSGAAEMATSSHPAVGNLKQDSSPLLTAEPSPAPVVFAPSLEITADKPVNVEPSNAGFSAETSSGSASAPARAREVKPSLSAPDKSSAGIFVPDTSNDKVAANAKSTPTRKAVPAPTLAFDSGVESVTKTAVSTNKKLLMAVAATVLVAATAYNIWMHLGRFSGAGASTSPRPTATAAVPPQTVPVPSSAAASAESTSSSMKPTSKVAQPTGNAKTANPGEDQPQMRPNQADPGTSASKSAGHPIVLKGGHVQDGRSAGSNDAVAPAVAMIAEPGNGGSLPNLMNGAGSAPAPVLQTMSVSQGISQGLIIKKIAPSYPSAALRLRMEGSVQLLATVSKKGDISAVKVLSGDPSLAKAAMDAVKQWKYKPYLLDGTPVEIQTQVTVNFKLPH